MILSWYLRGTFVVLRGTFMVLLWCVHGTFVVLSRRFCGPFIVLSFIEKDVRHGKRRVWDANPGPTDVVDGHHVPTFPVSKNPLPGGPLRLLFNKKSSIASK